MSILLEELKKKAREKQKNDAHIENQKNEIEQGNSLESSDDQSIELVDEIGNEINNEVEYEIQEPLDGFELPHDDAVQTYDGFEKSDSVSDTR